MDSEELKKLPFYSWNCLTLCLEHRDIDLVIMDEGEMEKVLKFLVFKLRTIDGVTGSAEKILKRIGHHKQS